jgi:hypothetical protein
MKIYLAYIGDIDFGFVGGAFKNKEDAFSYIRKECYNESHLNRLKRSINVVLTEEDIVKRINERIQEIELQ